VDSYVSDKHNIEYDVMLNNSVIFPPVFDVLSSYLLIMAYVALVFDTNTDTKYDRVIRPEFWQVQKCMCLCGIVCTCVHSNRVYKL